MCIKYTKLIALLALVFSILPYSIGSIGAQDLKYNVAALTMDSNAIREYKKDAARLALGYVLNGRSPISIGLDIPQDIQDSLFNALTAIHNSSDPYAKKASTMGIHTKPKPNYIDRIVVDCTPDAPLTKYLRSGGTSTANPEINALLDQYKLEIDNYNNEENSFDISAPIPINMCKLAIILSKLDDGIEYTEVPEADEPNHNIEASHKGNDIWIITFTKEENDTQEKWSFKVDDNEQVQYLAE